MVVPEGLRPGDAFEVEQLGQLRFSVVKLYVYYLKFRVSEFRIR